VGARSKARKRALDVLFEADQRGVDAVVLLAERIAGPGAPVRPAPSARTGGADTAQSAIPEYAVEIVEGVWAHRERIDELLSTYSQGWTMDRMPAVDRAALRIGAWELLYNDAVPDAVALDEAVQLVSELSTDESPTFVNGLLARLLEVKPAVRG
jgi:N utilization substance protein B